MDVSMRKACRFITVVAAAAALLSACGSTTDEDALVMSFHGFTGDGITQADQVHADLAEVDILQSCCSLDLTTGLCTDVESYTETSANAVFQNNQQADIIIDRYEVEIADPDAGVPRRERNAGSQVVTGKRCTTNPTQPCATDGDCAAGLGLGICLPSESFVQVLLFDFSDKLLILPRAEPFGATLPVNVRFFGRDLSGGEWRANVGYKARFDSFNNCEG